MFHIGDTYVKINTTFTLLRDRLEQPSCCIEFIEQPSLCLVSNNHLMPTFIKEICQDLHIKGKSETAVETQGSLMQTPCWYSCSTADDQAQIEGQQYVHIYS